MVIIQATDIILPVVHPLGIETETVNDLVEHVSREFPVDYLQEKTVEIMAVEVVAFGVPGDLNCWVEISPVPSANNVWWPAPLPVSALGWKAIGGGGGALPPVAPTIELALGVNATIHPIIIPWAIHSVWARLVVQTPVSATPLTAFWQVQAVFNGGSK